MKKVLSRIGVALGSAAALLALAAPARAGSAAPSWTLDSETVFVHLPATQTAAATAIAQDRQGFIWIGTDSGLLRWDGYRMQSYAQDPGLPGSLPDNFVRCLLVDHHGRLWIGTNAGGLGRYDPDHDEFLAYPGGTGGTADGYISALADDGAGGLWVGTGKGLGHLDGTAGRLDTARAQLPPGQVSALMLDRFGTLWVGTRAGLWRRAAGGAQFEAYALPVGQGAAAAISALRQEPSGRIWIGTRLHGAFVLEPGDAAPHALLDSSAGGPVLTDTITGIREIGTDEVWLGTSNSGIVRVNTVNWRTVRERHDDARASSLASNEINAIFQDRGGMVWVASVASLSHSDPRQRLIQTFFGGSGPHRLLSSASVASLMALPDGRFWAGLGEGGVDIIDAHAGRVGGLRPDPARPSRSLPKSKVEGMALSPDGSVFLATEAGLYRASADGGDVRRLTIPSQSPGAASRCLLFAGKELWVGGSDGLWALRYGSGDRLDVVRHYGHELGDPRIASITRGREGDLWIGTNTGLLHLDRASGRLVDMPVDPGDKTSLPGGFVSSVLTDRKGRLWVATYGRGIQVERGRRADGKPAFFRLTQRGGLPQNRVDMLLMDAKGDIWASTDDGLARIEPDTLRIHTYRAAQGAGFSGYWAGSGAVMPGGDLLFGGLSGLIAVHPDRLDWGTVAPSLAFTEARVGNQPVLPASLTQGIRIGTNERSLDVEFAALDYADPEHLRYSYRLQGFDAQWLETPATRRLAAYTNLAPGDYTLQLRSASEGGAWGTPLELPVHVQAAWYQTAGARAALAALAASLVALLVQLRTLVLRRRQLELERLVSERTAELRRSQEQLAQMAYFDPLTGLPNRRMFNEHLRRMIAARQRGQGEFALLLIDLDGFKPVNDTLGHAVGDALLVAIGNQLLSLVRETDLAARLGGDEFAVLLSQTSGIDAIELTCARIVRKLGEPLVVAGHSVHVGASIGIVPCPRSPISADELFNAADSALYEAKQAGRSTWRWGSADAYTYTA
jgi:diguanylate cyclase (GGDEF)-like protein